jgi:leucyl-tRNA synthetase
MMPIIPHFASESLEMLKKSDKKIEWPKFDEKLLEDDFSTIVVQINGKKRGILKLKKNIEEENLYKIITEDEKLNKYLIDKKVKRKIFIKNKLINIII